MTACYNDGDPQFAAQFIAAFLEAEEELMLAARGVMEDA